jgi:ketosteroid isomerase-like protein
MNTKLTLLCVCAGILSLGCSQSAIDEAAEAEALKELSRQWSNLIASGEFEAGMDYWANDAVMLPPEMPMLKGKEAIRDYVMTVAAIPGFRIRWEPEQAFISESGDLGYLIERNVIEVNGEDGEKIVTHGKAVTIWRKEPDGNWRNVVDMWNMIPTPAD